jgi:hypothetical protein
MVGLLDLPSELLFQIIDLVLSAPIVISEHGTRHRPAPGRGERNLYCIPKPEFLQLPNALRLLLINQRMYAETKEYLSRKSPTFKFDIAIVNDFWFWPTWREVPICKPTGRPFIEKMEIEVILCYTEDERNLQVGWDTDDIGGYGGPPPFRRLIVWDMLSPVMNFERLNKMVCKDHTALGVSCSNAPVTRIDNLEIKINTTRYGNGNELISEAKVPFRKIDGLAHLDFGRLYPAHPRKSTTFLSRMRSFITEWVPKNPGDAQESVPNIGTVMYYVNGEPL